MNLKNKEIDNNSYFKLWMFDTFLVGYAYCLGLCMYLTYLGVVDKYFK